MLAGGDISGAPLGGRQCLFSDWWAELSVRVSFGLPGELWENEMCFLQSMVWSGPLELWRAVAVLLPTGYFMKGSPAVAEGH